MQKGKSIEQKQLKEINQINEGLVGKLFKKLFSSRIQRVLKQAGKDGKVGDAIDAYIKATHDLATNLQGSADILADLKDPTAKEKRRIKLLKKLGLM